VTDETTVNDMVAEQLERYFIHELALGSDATDWLIQAWKVMQFFDDVTDGDVDMQASDVYAAMLGSIIYMPNNPFYLRHMGALTGAVTVAMAKWTAANAREARGEADAFSFIWRAGYYDLLLLVYALEHGAERALEGGEAILALYGETFDVYCDEMAARYSQKDDEDA